ncbi:MAG: ATP-binding protein [Pseudomonadota bacterium]
MFQSTSFWENFGNYFPSSVVIIKKNGDIVYENTVFKKLVSLTQSNLFFFIDQDCLKELNENLFQAEETKEKVSCALKIKKAHGEIYHFICYLAPLENDHFSLMLIDNTAINNENMMLRNIIDAVSDPIFVKDDLHRWTYVNQAFSNALGYPVEQLNLKSDRDFFTPQESEVFYKLDRKTFKMEKTTINEENFTGITGKTRIISTKKSVFRTLTGSKILVGIIRDITEIKKARGLLKKHASELKRKVASRTKQLEVKTNDLEQAIEKLKNLNSDLDCFAHICCHELREPLRAISSFSKLLKNEHAEGKNENIDHFLQLIHEGTLRMDKLIKSVLEYSSGGLRTNSMSSFSSSDLIREVLSMLDSQIQEKNAVIAINEMPIIYADRLQIMQLFQNLINNAIKFTAASSPPIISISAKEKNNFVEFQIKDIGIGISKKYHKEIFLPFKKFHSKSEGSTHGIGLSLCKKIVENHGGLITVISRENVGTTFKFLLPLQPVI